MIKHINIQNFKSIKEASIELSYLNLFTGVNASGKSTFLQSLLLLRQSYLAHYLTGRNKALFLGNSRDKETLTNLGTFKDVLYENAQKDDRLVIGFTDNVGLNVQFHSKLYDSDNKGLTTIAGSFPINSEYIIETISLFSDNFQYLCADRIAPQEDYPRFEGNELLGKDGAFTAHFLEKYGNKPITIKSLKHERTQGDIDTLIGQVNYWMQDISPNINIQTKENLTTNNIELSYRYVGENGLYTPQDRKPQNVGYGITTTLPILVAILSAKPGDIIIIENPETHIHPKGQAKLVELMALAAESGVQLMIETQSDHFINGLLVAIKKQQIKVDNTKIYYFDRNEQQNTRITNIPVSTDSRIRNPPTGFFDQITNDRKFLMGF
jgi:predicted ATPase